MSMTEVASGDLSDLSHSGFSFSLSAGKISRKMIMVLGICLTVGAGGGAGFAGISAILFRSPDTNELRTLTADKTGLQAQVTALTADKTGLQAQVTALTGDKAGLQAQAMALTADKTGLQAQVTALTGDKAGLQAQVMALTGDKTGLLAQVTSLTGDKNSLQAQVTALTGDKNGLQAQVSALTEQRDIAKEQVDTVYRDMAQISSGMGQENKNLQNQLMEIMNKLDRHCVLGRGFCFGL